MITSENTKMLSVSEAAKMMGIGRTKVYEEINAGNLPANKYGRRTLIPIQSVKIWAEKLPTF